MFSREDIIAEYERFVKERPFAAGYMKRDRLPHVDHSVFGNITNEQSEGWISPLGVPVTLFIAEAPPWNYDEARKSPYFYSIEPGSGVSDKLLKGLAITDGDKSNRLLEFKKQGGLLLDSIKCPVKVSDDMRRQGDAFNALIDASSRFLKDELQALKKSKRNIRCIVALGMSALKAVEKLDGTRGVLPVDGNLVEWMKRYPNGKRVESTLGPVLPWFMLSGANPWANPYLEHGKLRRAIEESIR